jgi:glycine cleavage system regulatory protein
MFHAEAVLEAPPQVDLDQVKDALEGLSGELTAEFPASDANASGVRVTAHE